jgi:nucleotide-binding universal stress UspA family protein
VRNVLPDDLIVQTGRPVLVVPKQHRPFDFRCALVAWKETREARRALADALPLVIEMDQVVLLEIAEAGEHDRAEAGLERLVRWLDRHGVKAVPRVSVPAGRDADRILAVADEVGADLIVAGAYGHSRLRERVLGGVTHDLLRGSDRCLLLSH